MGTKLCVPRDLGYKITMGRTMIGCDGKLNMVHCKVCSEIDKREKLLVPKFNIL
jgi:hypothetical protein